MTLPPVAVIILDKIYRRYRHLHQQIEAIWYEITSKYKVIWYEIMSGLAQVEHFFLLFPEIEFTNMSLECSSLFIQVLQDYVPSDTLPPPYNDERASLALLLLVLTDYLYKIRK